MAKRQRKQTDIPLGTAAEATEDAFRISTIPSAFYGGKNPTVYSKATSVTPKKKKPPEVLTPLVPPVEKDDVEPQKKHRKRNIILLILLLCLIVTGAVTWFVLDRAGVFNAPVSPVVSTPVIVEEPIVVEAPVVPVVPVPTTTPPIVEEPVVPTSTDALFTLEFPRLNNTMSVDLDDDGLTDAEEAVFETDPGILDSDEDGYFDAREVRNLYNPTGFAPVKIIDSSIVREYINVDSGYRLYYPRIWDLAAVNNDASEILISSISGDYIAVYTRERKQNETFLTWFDRESVGEDSQEISEMLNRFDVPVFVRSDGLVGYVFVDERVYTIVYYPNETQPVSYRAVMNVLLQSFRPEEVITRDIPDQIVLPGVNDGSAVITSSTDNSAL